MKHFIVSVCLLHLLVCTFALPEERVAGGEVAKEGQFPFAVSLEKRGKHNCGGSIINNRWILTAAHCIKTHPVEELVILAGTLNRTSGGIRYQVEQAIMHDKEWDADNFGNDMGLIKVAEEIQFTDKIQPVGLNQEHIEPDMWLTLCGWGRTRNDGHSIEDLHYIDLKVINREKCQSMHKHEIKDYMMCTLTKVGEGSCKGDSGSPLLLDGRIAGISSWGKKCGHGNPNVYTRMEYFIDWIYKTIEENS